MSGENREGRAAMDRLIGRIKDNQEQAGKPFDLKDAKRQAQAAAIRTDQRQNGTRKSPKK